MVKVVGLSRAFSRLPNPPPSGGRWFSYKLSRGWVMGFLRRCRAVILRYALALTLVCIHSVLVAWGATRKSPSWDEVGHLASGIIHWRAGRFDLYRVNPPLVRLVAALPEVLDKPVLFDIPRRSMATAWRPEWEAGHHLLVANPTKVFSMFARARWACIPLSVLGAAVCFAWAREISGDGGGLLALTLWCFSPDVLGCGMLITPDLGAASVGLLASYLFWRWLDRPIWGTAVAAGVALGLAELTKFTWIILYGLWPLLWTLRLRSGFATRNTKLHGTAGQLVAIVIISVLVINVAYRFEGSGTQLRDYRFSSHFLGGRSVVQAPPLISGGNRFSATPLGGAIVPLPREYLLGIDRQKRDFESGMVSYLFGEFRHRGWWYYHLVGLALKFPVGTMLLIIAASCYPGGDAKTLGLGGCLALLAPPCAVLGLLSYEVGYTHHMRYVLPALPYIFVWAGRALGAGRPGRVRTGLVAAALTYSVASSLWYYPHSLSYFNELAGGPTGAHRFMGCGPMDSSLDWGQDVIFLKEWVQRNPERRLDGIAYDCTPEILTAAGLGSLLPPPVDPQPGRYAIGIKRLYGQDTRYRRFRRLKPAARLGYSLLIFEFGIGDAAPGFERFSDSEAAALIP